MQEPRLLVGLGFALAGCAALVSVPAAAGPKQPPARTVECGEVLTQSLRVANNLRDCPANGLVVGAPGLTLDLGGHLVHGALAAGSVGIDNSAGHDGVVIRNGIVSGFETGVRLENASGNGVTGLRIYGMAGAGVLLVASPGNRVEGNVASGNDNGFRLDPGSNDNALIANDASGNRTDGVYVESCSRLAITRNLASGNGAYGLELFGIFDSTVKGNETPGNDIDGIILDLASADNLLKGNRASANDRSGIEAVASSSGNVLVGNTTHENGEHGILAETSSVTLKKNKANGNGFQGGGPGDDFGLGVFVPAGATSAGNKAAGNDDPNECEASDLDCHVP